LKAIKVIIVLVFGFESLNKLGSTWNGRHELIDFSLKEALCGQIWLVVNTFDEIFVVCCAVIIRSNFEIHVESFSDEHFEE